MEPNFQPTPPRDEPTDETPAIAKNDEQIGEQPYFDDDALSQPDSPTFEPSQSVGPDAFAPAPYESRSTESTPTPPLSTQDVVDPTTFSKASVAPIGVPVANKKSMVWLWTTIGAALLIVLGLVAGYFVVKGAADTAAQEYTASVKNYVDDIYDAATSPAVSPSDIVEEIEDIKAPVLEPALLGELSDEYTSAETLQNQSNEKVDVLTKKMNEYARVDVFYTDYQKLYASLQALDAKGASAVATREKVLISAYLKEFLEKLEEIYNLVDSTSFSGTLGSDVEELGRVHRSMVSSWGGMSVAFDNGNSVAYDSAYDRYADVAEMLANAKQPVVVFFNDLSSKSRDTADELKAYRDTIK